MKAFAIFLSIYMVSLVSGLPIISKPLENNPDHLVWEALLSIDNHRSDDKTRKIPKSIFITPNLNESKGNCPPDHKLGPDGRCYKTLQIDPLIMLKKQIESLLKNNHTTTTEYDDDDYDYSEYGESTESMNSNGQYTIPLSLGFSSDNRIPQQTTFSNSNRVVKDDAHVSSSSSSSSSIPTSTDSITVTTNRDNRKNQPFRATTTGIDLDTEEIIVESKPKSIASVATTSSTIPSTENTDHIETITNKDSTQNSNSSESSAATTIKTIHFDSVTDAIISNLSTNYYQNMSSTSTTTEIIDTSSSVHSSSIKSIANDLSSTDKMENTTQPMNTISNESSENNTDNVISPVTSTISNIETLPMTTSEVLPMSSSTTERIDSSTTVQTENSSISLESSTKTSFESVETQNVSPDIKLLALSSNDDAVEKFTSELLDESTEKQLGQTQSLENQPPMTEQNSSEINKIPEKIEIVEPSVVSMNLKLTPNLSTEQPTVIITPIPNTMQPSSSSTIKDRLAVDKNDFIEVVEAYFIPSKLSDEIDPAVGKLLNTNISESRYRLENTTEMLADELGEAELAPVIDTGLDGHSNIELVKSSDDSTSVQFEDKKNLTDRLAEELLFQEPILSLPNQDDLPNKSAQDFNQPFAKRINDELLKSELIENQAVNKKMSIEEALSGASIGGDINFGGDVTTEEPIDYYDSKEIKDQMDNVKPEIIKKIDSELPSRAAIPFNRQSNYFQLPSSLSPKSVQPTVYSTFISRLKVAPPFVELHDHHPETIQYSHTPFDITSSFRRTSRPDRRFNVGGTTHSSFGHSDLDGNFDEHSTPVRAKSLQIGINCSIKNLNKQQYIICEDV